jgi:hypothetical protein
MASLSVSEWNRLQEDKYFYEELDAPEYNEGGSLKTGNPDGDPIQRPVVHVSDEESDYQKTVAVAMYAHGKLGTGNDDEATLLVIRVQFACHKRKTRYKSAVLRFEFSARSTGDSVPEVISYEPFNKQTRSMETEVDHGDKTHFSVNAGAEYVGKAGVDGGKEWEDQFKKIFFRQAHSEQLYNEKAGKFKGVKWVFKENGAQQDGVEPDFHLFMLLKPAKDSKGNPRPFDMKMHMRVELEPLQNAFASMLRFFRPGKEEDAPVTIDHQRALQVHATGARIERLIRNDLNALGKYRNDGLLPLVAIINKPASISSATASP